MCERVADHAVCNPQYEALSDSGKAQLDGASISRLHHAGICQLLGEPERQQCRGAAVPPV